MSKSRDIIDFLAQRPAVRRDLQDAMSGALSEFLSKHGAFIPAAPYGEIQKELPENYRFEAVEARLERDRAHFEAFFEELKAHFYSEALNAVPENAPEDDPQAVYWKNGYFSRADARALYAIAAVHDPRRWVEVGVGYSTRFLRKAIEEHGLQTRITSIDPSPRAEIEGKTDEHIEQNLLDVQLDTFAALKAGDVFFLDGSHVMLQGTDVTHALLNVFPVLKPGVLVHVHDIYLPFEYPAAIRVKQFNEQHALAAMLQFSDQWDVLLPVHFMRRTGMIEYGGGSFWMRKTA